MGQMLQSVNHTHGELVKLEDPEFEKEFVVYSTDQVEARYILTTSLMQRILNYKKMTGERIDLAFVGNKIYVAIWKSSDPFEPSVFGTLLDFDQVLRFYERLKIVIRIVDDLNLNTRIWTRQAAS